MIQIIIIGVGFLGLAHFMSTPEQRQAARRDVKKLEPYAIAVTIAGVGFVAYAWYRG
jgi:hypothetical protein